MKKLFLIFIVVILLFSGCKNNNYRNVELTDFEYHANQIENSSIVVIDIIPKIDLKDLNVNYHLKTNIGIIETNSLVCGDLTLGRTYSFILNSRPNGYTNNSIEIFSATGKVDINSIAIEREAVVNDITYNKEVINENGELYFLITPNVYINDCFITFKLTAEKEDLYGISTQTKHSSLTFTKELNDVKAGTEYKIEVPNYEIDTGFVIKFADIRAVKGTVK